MNLTILTQPAYEPVGLADVYLHLRLDPDDDTQTHPDDDMLTRHIATARREVERITKRALVRQQLRLTAASFCNLQLLRPPLISVESVRYYDTGNTLRTLSADSWFVTDDLVPGLEVVNNAWPITYVRRDAVQVTYWAGYPADGSPGDTREALIGNVPSEVKDAILIGVELLYDQLSPDQRDRLERARASLLEGLKVYGAV